jgi:hypothetical protein
MPNRYPLKRILIVQGLYVLGFILLVIAAACFYGYGKEYFASLDKADKSLIYWYLPILFMGFFSLQGAIACGIVAWRRSKQGEP